MACRQVAARVANEDGSGNEARKPKQHGEQFETQHDEAMGEFREAQRRHNQVHNHQHRPEGDKDHEVKL